MCCRTLTIVFQSLTRTQPCFLCMMDMEVNTYTLYKYCHVLISFLNLHLNSIFSNEQHTLSINDSIRTHLLLLSVFNVSPFYCWFYTPLESSVCIPSLRVYITCCSHLGEEVALYCSKYLPEIIKEQKNYKDGKLQKVRSRRSRCMIFTILSAQMSQ